MNFIDKHGRLIDLIGAALFAIMLAVSAVYEKPLFCAAFAFGLIAFALSALVWRIRSDNIVDDLFVEDDRAMITLCRFFAILSAVALVIAAIHWVLA